MITKSYLSSGNMTDIYEKLRPLFEVIGNLTNFEVESFINVININGLYLVSFKDQEKNANIHIALLVIKV